MSPAGDVRADPADVDPAHADPADSDPAHADPAHVDPADPDPAHVDPADPDPAHADPAHADHAHAEHAEPHPAHADPAHADHADPDPAHADPAHADHADPDPAHADPADVDPADVDPAHAYGDDHRLAAALATRAGTLLLDLRQRRRLEDGSDLRHPDDLRDAGDRLAHELLAAALGEARPHDALLSEEAPDDRSRLAHRRVWIIDPLDGTRQYGEPGRGDWAVHVALVIDGTPLVGAVALPAEGVTLSTAEPPALPPSPSAGAGARLRVIASRSRPGPHATAVAAALGAELDALGSVGAKVAEVIRGRADAYVHSGGQSEWDSAAPVAVALACGLHASRLDGRPLRYNRADTELPDLLVCRREIADAALAAAATVRRPR